MESQFFTQAESVIGGRHVWRHLVSTPIGNIHIVQYEVKEERNIITFLYEEKLEAAERKYIQLVTSMASGKI